MTCCRVDDVIAAQDELPMADDTGQESFLWTSSVEEGDSKAKDRAGLVDSQQHEKAIAKVRCHTLLASCRLRQMHRW